MKNGSHQVGKVEVEEGDYYIYLTHIYIFESLQKNIHFHKRMLLPSSG